jgi:hypothetical protein
MTWFRVNDRHNDHPKVERLEELCGSDGMLYWAARGVWEGMGVDCASRETDGNFTRARFEKITRTLTEKQRERIVGMLVESGLWDATDAGHVFHDWSDYQPTKAQLDAQRKAKSERQKSWRRSAATGPSTGVSRGRSVDASTSVSRDASTAVAVEGAPARAPAGRVFSSPESLGSAEGAEDPEAPLDLWDIIQTLADGSTPPDGTPRIQLTVLGANDGAYQGALDELHAQHWRKRHFVAWANLARDGADEWWSGEYTTLTVFGRATWDPDAGRSRCPATGLLRCLEETRKRMATRRKPVAKFTAPTIEGERADAASIAAAARIARGVANG